MVQNGKFSAPMPALVNALNRVDLPTLGRPTMPQLKPMECLCWYWEIWPDYTGVRQCVRGRDIRGGGLAGNSVLAVQAMVVLKLCKRFIAAARLPEAASGRTRMVSSNTA